MGAPLVAALPALLLVASCGSQKDEPRPRSPLERLDAPADVAADSPAPPALEIPADAPLVVFLGDSISAGLHLAADQAFPAVVQRRLVGEGLPFRLVNAGLSGDTSAGGLARVDWLLRQEPDVLVVGLGGNDGLRGVPLASVEQNLRGICERALEGGAQVLLLGVRIPPNYGDYAVGFEGIYGRLAKELEISYLPFFMEGVGGVEEKNLADGMHPIPEGHVTIAEKVAPALGRLLER
jgi:acyl-CoA thioesterase I